MAIPPAIVRPPPSEGLGVRKADTVALMDAIRRFKRATGDEYATTYESTAVRGLEKETRQGYAAALSRLARTLRQQPGATARESLEDHLLDSARTSSSESGTKKVLSAVRVLEKFGWVELLVMPMDVRFVKAISAFHDTLCRDT